MCIVFLTSNFILCSSQQSNQSPPETVGEQVAFEKSYFRPPTHMEMDAYWLEEFYHCGEYLKDSKEEVCRQYFHGKYSPFNAMFYEPRHSPIVPSINIEDKCCEKPCDRWTIKDYCGTDSDKYPLKDSVLLNEHLASLRNEMDTFWTYKDQYCDDSVAKNITAVCDMFKRGRYSPLLIPDYTPANSNTRTLKYSPTTEPDHKYLLVEHCCEAACSRWTLKAFCYWDPVENEQESLTTTATVQPAMTEIDTKPWTLPATKIPSMKQHPTPKTPKLSIEPCVWLNGVQFLKCILHLNTSNYPEI